MPRGRTEGRNETVIWCFLWSKCEATCFDIIYLVHKTTLSLGTIVFYLTSVRWAYLPKISLQVSDRTENLIQCNITIKIWSVCSNYIHPFCKAGGRQIMAQEQNLGSCLLAQSLAKMAFTFLNDWKNSKKNNISWHVNVVWKFKLQCPKIRFHWDTATLPMSMAAFTPQGGVKQCERIHEVPKPEIFTIWSFTEKVFKPMCWRKECT